MRNVMAPPYAAPARPARPRHTPRSQRVEVNTPQDRRRVHLDPRHARRHDPEGEGPHRLERQVVESVDVEALVADLAASSRSRRWVAARARWASSAGVPTGCAASASTSPSGTSTCRDEAAHPDFPGMEVEREALVGVVATWGRHRRDAGRHRRSCCADTPTSCPSRSPARWRTDPFAARADGTATGRGACDMLGGVAAIIAAVRALATTAATRRDRSPCTSSAVRRTGSGRLRDPASRAPRSGLRHRRADRWCGDPRERRVAHVPARGRRARSARVDPHPRGERARPPRGGAGLPARPRDPRNATHQQSSPISTSSPRSRRRAPVRHLGEHRARPARRRGRYGVLPDEPLETAR